MNPQPFVKYTSCGNNFVILDQLGGRSLSEEALSRFAYQATSPSFGVGADNLLVVQPADEATLGEIDAAHRYWDRRPSVSGVDAIFRMFEPDGEEALCCGNGLMCIAHYLNRRYVRSSARVLTEVPFHEPNRVTIGVDDERHRSWVNLGAPRRAPEAVFSPGARPPEAEEMVLVEGLSVPFRKHDLAPFTDATCLELSGYLVFTGEPHLVMFPQTHFSLSELTSTLFVGGASEHHGHLPAEKRINFGTWLLRRIGYSLNHRYRDLFPAGVNVNLARVAPELGGVEYRCFERGIDRETLACGTGALAVAYVSSRLGLAAGAEFEVLPHRCRWQEPRSIISVTSSAAGWTLSSAPRQLFEGTFVDELRPLEEDLAHGTFSYERSAVAEMDETPTR